MHEVGGHESPEEPAAQRRRARHCDHPGRRPHVHVHHRRALRGRHLRERLGHVRSLLVARPYVCIPTSLVTGVVYFAVRGRVTGSAPVRAISAPPSITRVFIGGGTILLPSWRAFWPRVAPGHSLITVLPAPPGSPWRHFGGPTPSRRLVRSRRKQEDVRSKTEPKHRQAHYNQSSGTTFTSRTRIFVPPTIKILGEEKAAYHQTVGKLLKHCSSDHLLLHNSKRRLLIYELLTLPLNTFNR
mmetsp:Transcript_35471/g.80039  ORF Transcript_35471/g.80039 Transcript_35471/m.80039 type:complete len:242 (+) Transcript_35471:897-1622(+)